MDLYSLSALILLSLTNQYRLVYTEEREGLHFPNYVRDSFTLASILFI